MNMSADVSENLKAKAVDTPGLDSSEIVVSASVMKRFAWKILLRHVIFFTKIRFLGPNFFFLKFKNRVLCK